MKSHSAVDRARHEHPDWEFKSGQMFLDSQSGTLVIFVRKCSFSEDYGVFVEFPGQGTLERYNLRFLREDMVHGAIVVLV